MSHNRTAEEIHERRRGWLTLLVVALLAVAFFAAIWAVGVLLYLSSSTDIG